MAIKIDEYFCVNLDRRTDRLVSIIDEIKKSQLLSNNIKKWTEVDGRDINPCWIPASFIAKRAYEDLISGLPVQRGLSITPGALGFYLTHTKIFEYSVDNNKTLFVMDDDIDIHPDFDKELEQILLELPSTFDFCYLGYYDTKYEKLDFSTKLFIPKGQFCGPHAYVVSPHGAKKILNLIYPIDIQLDSKLYTIQNNIAYYAAYERLARYKDLLYTDIQHETGCIRNYKKIEPIKQIVNIKNPVIVTALYDIGRDNWDSFTLSYNTYLRWMKNTLSLKSKIVIYTENKFVKKITEYRKEFDPDLKDTIIIERPIEELDCYKLYNNKLSKLMSSENFTKKIYTHVPEMTQPLYNIIMFNKLHFLQDVKEKQYFNNDALIWVDAGGLRESIDTYKDEEWPCLSKLNQLNTSKATFFSHSKNIIVENKEYHALSQVRYIQGTAFLVPSYLIDDLTDNFNKTINECLENNYIGSDEKIFDLTYCKNPDKYNLIKCTWRTYFKILQKKSPNIFNLKGEESNKVFIDLGSYKCDSIKQKIDELDIDDSWDVYAFEPNPLIDTEMYAKQINSCNVKVYKEAVWKRQGKAIFNQHGDEGQNQGSLLEETGGGRHYCDFYSECIVKCIDFYEFLKQFDESKEIYIHMDIEHSEYELIQHMLQKTWPNNIKKLWIEWHDYNNNQEKVNGLENAIRSKGIEIESKRV